MRSNAPEGLCVELSRDWFHVRARRGTSRVFRRTALRGLNGFYNLPFSALVTTPIRDDDDENYHEYCVFG